MTSMEQSIIEDMSDWDHVHMIGGDDQLKFLIFLNKPDQVVQVKVVKVLTLKQVKVVKVLTRSK